MESNRTAHRSAQKTVRWTVFSSAGRLVKCDLHTLGDFALVSRRGVFVLDFALMPSRTGRRKKALGSRVFSLQALSFVLLLPFHFRKQAEKIAPHNIAECYDDQG